MEHPRTQMHPSALKHARSSLSRGSVEELRSHIRRQHHGRIPILLLTLLTFQATSIVAENADYWSALAASFIQLVAGQRAGGQCHLGSVHLAKEKKAATFVALRHSLEHSGKHVRV